MVVVTSDGLGRISAGPRMGYSNNGMYTTVISEKKERKKKEKKEQ